MRRSAGAPFVISALLALLSFIPLAAQSVCPNPWRLQETLKIGSVDGPDALNGVNDFDIGRDGRIYVTQFFVPYVTVFDPRGRLVGTVGRAGDGPGELTTSAVTIGWKGDSLWVTDLNAMHLFTPDGKPAYKVGFSTKVRSEGSGFIAGAALADGTFLGRRSLLFSIPGTRLPTDPSFFTGESFAAAERLPLLRFSRSGAILDTIAWSATPARRMITLPSGGVTSNPLVEWNEESQLPVVVAPGASSVILLGDIRDQPPRRSLFNLNGFFARRTGSFDLLRIGIEGDTLLKAVIPYEPKSITAGMREWLDESFAARAAGDFTPDSPMYPMKPKGVAAEMRRREARGVMTFPENLPPVRQIVAGRDGTIWLLREFREDRADLWEVYNGLGRLEGTALISEGRSAAYPWSPHLKVLRATRDELWGMTLDDLDVPTIRKYRIDRSCR